MRPRLRKSVDVEPRLARWNEGRSTLTRVFGFCFCPSKRKSGRPGSATAVPTHRRRPSSAAAGHLAVDRSRVLLLCPWGHEPKERAPNGAHTLADDAHTAHHWRAHGAAATRARTRRRNRYRSVPRARCQDSRIAAAAELIKNDRFRSANYQRRPRAGCPCRRQTRAQNPSAGWYRSSPGARPPDPSAPLLLEPRPESRFGSLRRWL